MTNPSSGEPQPNPLVPNGLTGDSTAPQDVDEHREEAEHAKGLEEEFTPGHALHVAGISRS